MVYLMIYTLIFLFYANYVMLCPQSKEILNPEKRNVVEDRWANSKQRLWTEKGQEKYHEEAWKDQRSEPQASADDEAVLEDLVKFGLE